MRPLPSLFALGFTLGGATAWLWPHPWLGRPARSAAPHHQPPAGVRLEAWDWRTSFTPPLLTVDPARAAIAAWIALRGPDGGPAAFGTRAAALHALLARLPVEAYPRLLDALIPYSSSDDRDLLGMVFNLYADQDPAGAARWALATPPGDDFSPRWQATLAIQSWIARDAPAASAWVRSLDDPELLRELAQPLIQELAKTDPVAALQTYGPLLWDGGKGFWSLREPLIAWSRRDPGGAIAWLIAQSGTDRNGQSIGWRIGQITSPEQAPAMLQALADSPDFPGRTSARSIMLAAWAKERPDEALAYVRSLPERHLRNQLLESLTQNTWSDASSQTRLTFALALPESRNRERQLGWLIGGWAKKDPSAALAWIATQEDPAVRAAAPKAEAAILGAIARDEPATAVAEWQALTDPKTKTAAFASIIEAWSQKDPGAALRWMQTQPLDPDPIERGTILQHACQALYPWSLKEPEAALRWAESQPEHQTAYLQALAGDWRNKADRAAVSDLYVKITDPGLRTKVLTAHVREWLTKDRPAAQAWLEATSALTPEQAAALLASAPQP